LYKYEKYLVSDIRALSLLNLRLQSGINADHGVHERFKA